ncbi:MAG: hypothetical protein GF331_07630 [Chitinivibrionales bacterium]|nr:hypothetical protein [Chitinivibrionales bacterium]
MCVWCIGLAIIPAAAQDLAAIGKQKPFSLATNLSLNTSLYSATGIDNRQEPFGWQAAGTVTLGIYGLQLPISFVVGEDQRAFKQPFDQFGISPTYKWITLHGGHRGVTFSPYTLAGHTFLGGGIELNPGLFRSGFIYGRFVRAVQPDSLDSLQVREPAFSRYGWAAKLGVGKPDNYGDIIMLRAWDDSSSVRDRRDSTLTPPQDNIVVALVTRNTLFKVVTVSLEAAASGHTRDQYAPVLGDSESATLEWLRGIFDPNLSTTTGMALSGTVDAALRALTVNATYKRVSPGYASLGAYFIDNDLEAWSITPSLGLLDHRLRLTASTGMQHDDLAGTKTATTYRWRSMGGLMYTPVPLIGANIQYVNLSTHQRAGTISPLPDSTRLDQTHHQLVISPHTAFDKASLSGSGVLSYSWSYLHDRNPYSRDRTRSSVHTATLAGQLLPKAAGLTIAPSLTYTSVRTAPATNQLAGFSLRLNRPFLERALHVDFVNSYSWSIQDNDLGAFTYTSRLNGAYAVGKFHRMNLAMVFTRNIGYVLPSRTFSEFRGSLGYTFNVPTLRFGGRRGAGDEHVGQPTPQSPM